MQPKIKTSLAAAVGAFLSAFGFACLVHVRVDSLVTGLVTATLFGVLAATVAFGAVHWVVSRRFGKQRPALGLLRGALLALGTFVFCLVPHAAVFPGAGGFLPSLIGQGFAGLVLFGWAVALVGGSVGTFVERRWLTASEQSAGENHASNAQS